MKRGRVLIRLAILVVAIHAAWLLLVILGALWTRHRPVWSTLHILALLWGIVVEVGPWPCPLTLAEAYFETHATLAAYQASFSLRLLNAVVYPNLSAWIVAGAGVAVCAFNLAIYGLRFRRTILDHKAAH
jgi:hypothetical protein